MRKASLLSIGAPALALLGAQHHNLMLLLVVGLGGTGMSVMTAAPLVRTAMLLVSLAMVAVVGYQISRSNRPLAMRVTGAMSIVFTVGLAGWSILQFGL